MSSGSQNNLQKCIRITWSPLQMKLLKHREEKQRAGVSDRERNTIHVLQFPSLFAVYKTFTDRVFRRGWKKHPLAPSLYGQEWKEVMSPGNCFHWKKPFQVGRNKIWLGISARTRIDNKSNTVTDLGNILLALGVHDKSPVLIYQDVRAAVRSPNKKRHGFAQELESWLWSKIIFQGGVGWLWHDASHFAAPIPHRKAADANNSLVSEKYFAITQSQAQQESRVLIAPPGRLNLCTCKFKNKQWCQQPFFQNSPTLLSSST